MKRVLCVFLVLIVLGGCGKGNKNATSQSVNDVSIQEAEESSAVLEEVLTEEKDFFIK